MLKNEKVKLSHSQILGLFILCCFALLIGSYAISYPWTHSLKTLQAFKQGQLIPYLAYGHFLGGGIALLTGCFQLWTKRPSKLHSLLGYTYCLGVMIGVLCAFYLIAITEFSLATLGLLTLNIFWVCTTGYALKCALSGDIKTHRLWMSRSLALSCAAITFRFMYLGLMLFLNYEMTYLLVTWFSWIINLLLLEIYLRWELASEKHTEQKYR